MNQAKTENEYRKRESTKENLSNIHKINWQTFPKFKENNMRP